MITAAAANSVMVMAAVYLMAAVGAFVVALIRRYEWTSVIFTLLGMAGMFELMALAFVVYT